jgi:hypothetical protein
MLSRLKELADILIIAAIVFRLARPVALKFSSQADFTRRWAIWIALTILAFLSPSFWLLVLIAVPLLIWGAGRDSNPVAFYLLLLQVIPPVDMPIPVVGINELFDLNIFRLLSLCVLVPTALRLRRQPEPDAPATRFGMMDLLLLAFIALQVVLYVPAVVPGQPIAPDSFTNMLRRGFLGLLDGYIVYFVVSRVCAKRAALIEAMSAFCLCCALLAAMAIFEGARGWLLYGELAYDWTTEWEWGFHLLRGGTLRAMAATGHPLALGFMLAIAFGFWLYLSSHLESKRARIAGNLLYWGGLLAAYSRGPWFAAIAIYLAFAALGPKAFSRLFKAAAVLGVLLGALLASPLGDRVTRVLPITGGTVDANTVQYRERLAQRSWELITENPVFGDQLAFEKMADLRQGQGIIDLVNTYAAVALFYGFAGLFLFVGFILLALMRAWSARRRIMALDPDLGLVGACLVACIIGILLLLSTGSFGTAPERLFYVLAGLAIGYVQCVASRLQFAPARSQTSGSGPDAPSQPNWPALHSADNRSDER